MGFVQINPITDAPLGVPQARATDRGCPDALVDAGPRWLSCNTAPTDVRRPPSKGPLMAQAGAIKGRVVGRRGHVHKRGLARWPLTGTRRK